MLIDSTLKLCVVEYLCMFLSVLNCMTLEDKTHHLASTWKGLSIYSDNQTREQTLKDEKMLRLKRKIIKLDLWWRSDSRVSNSEFPVMSTKGTQRQTPVKRLQTSYAGNPHLEQPWINWKGHLECHKLSLIDATRGQPTPRISSLIKLNFQTDHPLTLSTCPYQISSFATFSTNAGT